MKILVSACLLGENCKYNGGNNLNQSVLDFIESEKRYTSIAKAFPERVSEFRKESETWIKERYEYYKKLSQ